MDNRKVIAIVGLGLLGGSLGLALRDRGFHRIGWSRRQETCSDALAMSVVDEAPASLEEAIQAADITVLATPLAPTVEILQAQASNWRRGSLVTDLGSLKHQIVMAAEAVFQGTGVNFVGSHPMAGTEKSGLEFAFPELYSNADVFLCPAPGCSPEALRVMADFWELLSCRIYEMDSERHDQLVARTSHVLHILASVLARSILRSDSAKEQRERFCGCATGFRDISRIAASSPAMWREIIELNQPAVLAAMKDFEQEYFYVKDLIERGDFDAYEQCFDEGRRLRNQWVAYKQKEASGSST